MKMYEFWVCIHSPEVDEKHPHMSASQRLQPVGRFILNDQ